MIKLRDYKMLIQPCSHYTGTVKVTKYTDMTKSVVIPLTLHFVVSVRHQYKFFPLKK